jgi:RNA 3'-terminal phosphate cyclase
LTSAESSTGDLISTERCAASTGGELPEDIGRDAALQLLEEIWRGGVVDSTHQPLVLLLMVMGPEDVCKVLLVDNNFHFCRFDLEVNSPMLALNVSDLFGRLLELCSKLKRRRILSRNHSSSLA